MKTNTERKFSNGGKPPFGLRAERVPIGGVGRDGRPREKVVWKSDPDEATAVRYAFEQRAQGKGPDQIAKDLSRSGYKTRAGRKLTANYVYNWFRLHHDTYAGRMVWNKFRREGTRTVRKPREKWIIVPDAFEPLVPPALSDRVYALVRQQDRSVPRPSNWANKPYLVTEPLRCAECGFSLNSQKSGGLDYAYYACTTAKKRHDCAHAAYYRTDLIDGQVLDIVCRNVLTRKTLQEWTDAINERIDRAKGRHDFGDERKQILALRSEAETRKARLVEAIASGRLPFTTVADAVDQEEKRIAQMDADLEQLKALETKRPIDVPPEAIERTLQGLHDVLKSRAPVKIKALLRTLIEKIEVTKDGRFTVSFDKSKLLAEAGVPNSFAYNDSLRDGHGEGDGARTLPEESGSRASNPVDSTPTCDTLAHNDLQRQALLCVPVASTRDTTESGSASTKQSKGSQTADADFSRLEAVWPKLSPADRAALLTLAVSLGATAPASDKQNERGARDGNTILPEKF